MLQHRDGSLLFYHGYMITVREIAPEAWAALKDIFRAECNSSLPHAKFAKFFGAYDENGNLKAWVLAENVVVIGQLFTVGDGKTEYVQALISHLQEQHPPGISVATVASETRFERLFKSLGMERISGTLFRRN